MKVTIITKRELQHPHLEIDVNLESGDVYLVIKHTCSNCAGYGCHGRGCDDTIRLTPDQVLATLGDDARPILERTFKAILGEKVDDKL